MADNYLEKKMEEHRRGGAPAYRRKLTPRGTVPGQWLLSFPVKSVLLPDIDRCPEPEMARKIIRQLAGIGFRVSFSCADSRAGSRIAQECGARFIPQGALPHRDASPEMKPGADIILHFDNDAVAVSAAGSPGSITVEAAGADAMLKSVIFTCVILANSKEGKENMLGNIKIQGDI